MRKLVCAFSGLLGSVFGIAFALSTSNILLVSTYNNVAGYVFGGFLVLFGLVLFIQTIRVVGIKIVPRILVLLLTLFSLANGVLCSVLDRDWFLGTKNIYRVLMYSGTSISYSFMLVYCLVQVLNSQLWTDICCKTKKDSFKPIVFSKSQIYLCIFSGIVLGIISGILFGTFDVEDTSQSYHEFRKFQLYIIPIGFGIGFIVGFLNEYFREKVFKERILLPIDIDESYFGDEISAIEEDNQIDDFSTYDTKLQND
ncbi:hypothetical protein M0813_10224 [Anaeramoeba flamelloides]|uniref:Transmembrane protein n=1 Tax=Anaeramoeba flamelloides TaxID=1746091 RepID=A0AAV7ZE84_9EUKA|nr:hypothetical protein M0812_16336 [Anaeramoeba flamelloides]KAJ6227071.1 hypothetical protein M0813_10224 [Anaeramoeba flamelloides]